MIYACRFDELKIFTVDQWKIHNTPARYVTLHGQIHHAMPVWRLFLRDGVAWFIVVFGKPIFVIRQHISDVSSCRRHGALDMGDVERHAETIACGVSLAFSK
jgi:hypothetical protein